MNTRRVKPLPPQVRLCCYCFLLLLLFSRDSSVVARAPGCPSFGRAGRRARCRVSSYSQVVEVKKERMSSLWNCVGVFFLCYRLSSMILLLFPLFDGASFISVLPTDAIGGCHHSLEFPNARWWMLALRGGRKELVMETPGWRWQLRRQRDGTATSCFRVTSTRLHSR